MKVEILNIPENDIDCFKSDLNNICERYDAEFEEIEAMNDSTTVIMTLDYINHRIKFNKIRKNRDNILYELNVIKNKLTRAWFITATHKAWRFPIALMRWL